MNTTVETLSNTEWHRRLDALLSLGFTKGTLGYAIARNTRILQSNLTEYLRIYDSTMAQNCEVSEGGEYTLTPEVIALCTEQLEPFANITHEITYNMVTWEEAMDQLSAEQMLKIDWMLEEDTCKE